MFLYKNVLEYKQATYEQHNNTCIIKMKQYSRVLFICDSETTVYKTWSTVKHPAYN